jgi:uncharacterized protein YdhG (YjbR/CyaY superfamily)
MHRLSIRLAIKTELELIETNVSVFHISLSGWTKTEIVCYDAAIKGLMKNYSAKNVDEYIASAPKEARSKLRELRAVIRSTVPKAEEGISWGVPFYKYHGLLAGFVALKNHVDFGLAFALQNNDRETLLKKGYLTGKKIIQIRFDQKVPAAVIKQIIKAKAKMNEAKRAEAH